MAITILLADDHRITREGIMNMLKSKPDMEVIGEARNGLEAVKLAKKLSPDVAIIDVTMPGLNGIDAARKIIGGSQNVKVIALSMHSDKHFVTEMFKAGASGYLLKDCAFEELVQAIRNVAQGQAYVSPEITGIMIRQLLNQGLTNVTSPFNVLTAREREVLQLVAEGKSAQQVANALNISKKTVDTHRRAIMNKLNMFSVAELTKYAIKEGLTTF